MSDVVRTVKYSARFGNKALEAELWEESGDKFLLRITQPQGKVDIELTLADCAGLGGTCAGSSCSAPLDARKLHLVDHACLAEQLVLSYLDKKDNQGGPECRS